MRVIFGWCLDSQIQRGTRAHCALGLAVKPTGVVPDKLFSEGLGVNGYYPTRSPIDTVLVAGMA